jgi:TolB-like protein
MGKSIEDSKLKTQDGLMGSWVHGLISLLAYKSISLFCVLCLILLAGIVTAGCAKPHVYIHSNPGLDRIKKIAVMSFDNLSKDDKAGEKVRIGFVIELLRTGSFNVMDIGETDRLLQRAEISYSVTQTPISAIRAPETAEEETAASEPLSKKIGDVLDVEAILAGSVEAYSSERIGDQTVPEVSISARLIDAETGIIIWASTHTRRGSMGVPIFGWGKITSLGRLSQQVIQDMVDSLAQYAP